MRLRVRGGKTVQTISEKNRTSTMSRSTKASDRYIARIEIARQVCDSVTAMSNKLCTIVIRDTLENARGSKRR